MNANRTLFSSVRYNIRRLKKSASFFIKKSMLNRLIEEPGQINNAINVTKIRFKWSNYFMDLFYFHPLQYNLGHLVRHLIKAVRIYRTVTGNAGIVQSRLQFIVYPLCIQNIMSAALCSGLLKSTSFHACEQVTAQWRIRSCPCDRSECKIKNRTVAI